MLTFPPHAGPWLPPYASRPLELALQLRLAVILGVARISIWPLVELGWLSRAFGAPDVTARLADGGGGRDEQGLALVAVAAHTLLRRLVGQLLAIPGGDGQHALLLGQGLCSSLLGLDLSLLGGAFLLGVAGALLATLVLALCADLVGAVRGSAAVAGAVDTHADGLFDALDVHGQGRGGNPFVGLEGEAVLGEQSAGTLLLHGGALHGGDGRSGVLGGILGVVLESVLFGGWRRMVRGDGSGLGRRRATMQWSAVVFVKHGPRPGGRTLWLPSSLRPPSPPQWQQVRAQRRTTGWLRRRQKKRAAGASFCWMIFHA